MGLETKAVVFWLIMMAVCGASMGAVYKVGDSAGWTNTAGFSYMAWAASKTFHVGDTIVFQYNNQFHNVIRVTHKKFNNCNSTAAYFSLNGGNDSFVIPRAGHFYFICGLPGHCQAGQKVDIRVPKTLLPPAPMSLPPFPTPPTPTPNPAPSMQPPPPPSSSPSPTPVPHLAPPSQPQSSPTVSSSPVPPPMPSPSLSPSDRTSPSQSPSNAPPPKKKNASSVLSCKLWLSLVVLALSIYGLA